MARKNVLVAAPKCNSHRTCQVSFRSSHGVVPLKVAGSPPRSSPRPSPLSPPDHHRPNDGLDHPSDRDILMHRLDCPPHAIHLPGTGHSPRVLRADAQGGSLAHANVPSSRFLPDKRPVSRPCCGSSFTRCSFRSRLPVSLLARGLR
jgi:hypothetical protein